MDGHQEVPEWVSIFVGSITVIAASLYSIGRLVFWWVAKKSKTKAAAKQLEDELQGARDDQAAKVKREAINEAWQTVDRLNEQVEKIDQDMDRLRRECDDIKRAAEDRERMASERAARCEREHAATKAMFKIIAAWAKQKRMPLPKQVDDILNEPDGSSMHPPLPGGQE